MRKVDEFHEGTWTATLYYDEHCSNPREDEDPEMRFLFLGFPHRSYTIGDEQLTGDDPFPCPDCDGEGVVTVSDGDIGVAALHDAPCTACDGYGVREATSLDELIEMVGKKYGARMVRPVHMIDHSGVTYRLGRGAFACDPGGWDSGTCGLILATHANLVARGGERWAAEITDEQLEQFLAAEIDEYSNWAGGDCYGYVVTDVNGAEADSCWGLIGYDYARSEALASLGCEAQKPDPPKLYEEPTDDEAVRIKRALREGGGSKLHFRLTERFPDLWAQVQDEMDFESGFNGDWWT